MEPPLGHKDFIVTMEEAMEHPFDHKHSINYHFIY